MDKIKLRTSALLLCIFLMCLCIIPISAAEGNGGLFGLPREAESIVGDVTGAVNDAIGEMTGNNADRPYDGEGTNIPEDSSGVITDTNPVTDPMTTAPSTTENRSTTADNTGTDTGSTSEDESSGGFIGIVIAIIAAIAVVLLIIALMPRKKNS